jgi:hypothetical protein
MTPEERAELRSDLSHIIWDGEYDGDLNGDVADRIIGRFDAVIRAAENDALERAADRMDAEYEHLSPSSAASLIRALKHPEPASAPQFINEPSSGNLKRAEDLPK